MATTPMPTPATFDPCYDAATADHKLDGGLWNDMTTTFFVISFAYFVPGALICLVAGRISKDPAFCRLLTGTAVGCMWMMWACVYLCQVSPLIRPAVRPGEPEAFLGGASPKMM